MSRVLVPTASRVSFIAVLSLYAASRVAGAVVIDEIHYEPPEGPSLEFVELQNPGAEAVPLAGWKLANGVTYTFGDGVTLEPDGFLVVARDRERLIESFGIDGARVFGPFDGALDNGGERLDLVDAQGHVIDSVYYDDDAPWDSRAAGGGRSLQRICATSDPALPSNWIAAGDPTPLAANPRKACPPPSPAVPAISINEIHYSAANINDAHEEFVELRNNTSAAVNLRGFSFSAGIDYIFVDDVLVPPGELIAVCRDVEYIKKTFGITNARGNFTGQLSNVGERITLVDGAGAFVDSVRYADRGDWPVVADSLGASLEKILPEAPSDDPRNWKASDAPITRNRQHVVVRGLATSALLTLQLDQSGECMIDELTLVDTANPGQNLIPGGNFDHSIGPVTFEGSHYASGWDPTGGTNGTGALRLKAKYIPGSKEAGIFDGFSNRASIDLTSVIRVNGPTYELAFDFTYLSGWRGFTAALLDSNAERGLYWRFDSKPSATPGRVNTAFAAKRPPQVSGLARVPVEPKSTDPVTISARIRADAAISSVKLTYAIDFKPETTTIDAFDDGSHGDGAPGDGIYGARLPAFPHNTAVTFQIQVQDIAGGVALSPLETDPTGVHGYYVNDLRPTTPLALYNILLQHTLKTKPRAVIDRLDCQHYWTGALAVRGDLYARVGIRMRGASVCRTPKPYLKLRFLRGRELFDQHKLNFQGLWTDKSLIRELVAFDLFKDVGFPCSRDEHVRVHANGQYYGLFTALENPDAHMLKRNGLDPDGNFYKSVGSNEEPNGGNAGPWEKKTNENGDYSDLIKFLKDMHDSSISKLRSFFSANVDEDRLIDYQLVQVLIDNLDHTAHNHFLYHDPTTSKWFPLPWDLDLTFGKAGVFDDFEIIPGFSPWFGTAVDGEFQNYLLDRFFSDAGSWYRRAYLVRLFDALNERFTEAFYETRLNELKTLLFTDQDEDIRMWGRLTDQGGGQFPRDFVSNLARVTFYVTQRRQYLLRYLDQRSHFTGHDRLVITELQYNPLEQDDDLEFIELWNPGDRPIDVSRWTIDAVQFAFPDGSRVDANEIVIVARDPAAFDHRYGAVARVFGPYSGKLDDDGAVLRLKDRGPGYPATVDLVRYGMGDGWPREANGLGKTLELTNVAPWRNNDVAQNWRASASDGGSPGVIEGIVNLKGHYRRGDSNADGQTNVTDVLVTLGYLFLGAGEPACRAASDFNGSGEVKLDDALFLLRHLFQGSQEPIPFPGPTDCGPVAVDDCRVSNCTF